MYTGKYQGCQHTMLRRVSKATKETTFWYTCQQCGGEFRAFRTDKTKPEFVNYQGLKKVD